MIDHISSESIIEKKIHIGQIPAILFRPKNERGLLPTILHYHGWSSSKESQRIRGFILASVGFQVIIPDAIHHGERDPLSNYDDEDAREYFWDTIFNNVEESGPIIREVIGKYHGDPERLGVIGNSMGGFTASGVFAHNPNIKALVVLNGSCSWEDSNKDFMEDLRVGPDENIDKRISDLDPAGSLEKLIDRSILLLHGDMDSQVSITCQRKFYREIKPLYKYKDRIKLMEYPKLDHFVTTNMMEESILWFKSYL